MNLVESAGFRKPAFSFQDLLFLTVLLVTWIGQLSSDQAERCPECEEKNDPLAALQDAWRFLYPEQALPDAGSVEEFWSYAVWSQP